MGNVYVSAWDNAQKIGGGTVAFSDGTYEITGIAAGSYLLEINASTGKALFGPVTMIATDLTGQDIVLVKATGTISGTTTAGGMVFVYDASDDFVGTTVSNSNGAYKIDGLETGVNYRVDVDTDGDFGAMEFTGNANPTTAAPDVTLDLQ